MIVYVGSYLLFLQQRCLHNPFGIFDQQHHQPNDQPRKKSLSISIGAGVKYSAWSSAYSKMASTSHMREAPQYRKQSAAPQQIAEPLELTGERDRSFFRRMCSSLLLFFHFDHLSSSRYHCGLCYRNQKQAILISSSVSFPVP